MPPSPPASALSRRILSAVVLAPPTLAAIWYGPPWSDLLIGLVALILLWEWAGLIGARLLSPAVLLAGLALAAALVLIWRGRGDLALLALLLAVAATLPAVLPGGGRPQWLSLGIVYIGLPCLAFAWLRHRPDGRELTLWLLVVVWAVDIFAYLVGRTLQGPKLWPRVSPNKTWSGLVGGVLAAAGVGALGGFWIAAPAAWVLALAGGCLALVAQGGDLLESAVKRRFGVKDASHLIPGHGGLLDRVDGLLAASLALSTALWLAEL